MIKLTTGSDAWWQSQAAAGIPTVEPAESGFCDVTFWWRDPAGDERHSPVKRVWLYVTGVTDHHARGRPQSLTRLPGTDVWRWQTRLDSRWRGSYCLIPATQDDDFPPAAFDTPPESGALRAGWRRLLPQAIADPFNAHQWRGGRGHATSALHLPDAPPQPGWEGAPVAFAAPALLHWRSPRLGNERRAWLFTTGSAQPAERPLAILLDGQFWAESMPVWPALQALTDAGRLPPAVYLLVDAVNSELRGRELTCNPEFWLALQQELLPEIGRREAWRDDPASTVVAGQSFGGLSALYAGLSWPERFGCVLGQSGSWWWPNRNGGDAPGWVETVLRDGRVAPAPRRIFLEAGVREPLIHQAHQRLVPLLRQTQPHVVYREVEGGHDALCWRGGLTDGLALLWSADFDF